MISKDAIATLSESYFSKTYSDARRRFTHAAKSIGADVNSYVIDAESHEELAIDVALCQFRSESEPEFQSQLSQIGVCGFRLGWHYCLWSIVSRRSLSKLAAHERTIAEHNGLQKRSPVWSFRTLCALASYLASIQERSALRSTQ